MKIKLSYLLLTLLFPVVFQSCVKDNEDSYEEWRKENEAYIEKIKSYTTDPESGYLKVSISGGPGTIYYQILEKGNGDISPISTSKVDIRYKGWLINDYIYDDAIDRTTSTYVNDNSASSKITRGHYIALQNMKEGDKWRIYIPWQLAYGSSGMSTYGIKPYSNLIVDLKLTKITVY